LFIAGSREAVEGDLVEGRQRLGILVIADDHCNLSGHLADLVAVQQV
jgi:hypothetical protein